MNKLFYSFFAAASLMFAATSCSQEEMIQNETTTGDEVEVMFNVEMEGQTASRAIADGLTVDQLIFAVFDENNQEITTLRQEDVVVSNKGAQVKTRLVKGQSYQFVFWAQKKDAGHYNTTSMKHIKLNTPVLNNDETRDAFYAHEPLYKVTGSFVKPITLKRPFAQLNLATTKEDLEWAEKAGVVIDKSSVKVTGAVYTTLNTLSGYCADKVEGEFELSLNAIPDAATEKLTITDSEDQFDIDEYYYLSTSYLLVSPKEALSEEIVFTLTAGDTDEVINTLTVTNAPLQRNWRTNIIGEILTGEGTFNIVIDPIFEADRNYPMDGSELDIWDGKTTTPQLKEGTTNWYLIDEASDLVGLAEMDEASLNGATFELLKDLSFKNVETGKDTKPATIKPLFDTNKSGGAENITFLGNDHVIRDFVVEGNSICNSLFGILNGGTIKNLTIINAEVNGDNENYNAWASILVAKTFGNVKLENVTIKDSKLTGGQKVGGLIGFVAENNVDVLNCTVDGLILENYDVMSLDPEKEGSGSTGGLIGYINAGKITNSYVKNSTIKTIQGIENAKRANGEFIGVINDNTIEITNCGVENNNFTNSIDWTPYHNPFVGGNRGSATLIVNGKTFQPVPTYTGETKFSELENVTLDGEVIDDQVVKHISNATFETLVLDETSNTVFLENVVVKEKLELPVANTVLLKNVSFETAKPFAFVDGAYPAQFQFIAYTGTVKVQGTIVTSDNMEELLGFPAGTSYMETTW